MRTPFLAVVLLLAAPAIAELPHAAPLPPPSPAPQDVPYPGQIRLSVDATDLERHIFRVHEVIPLVAGRPLTLLFPEWLPGNHAPSGPLADMAGLMISAGGRRVAWQRDTVDNYAFHVMAPDDVAEIALDFDYLSPIEVNQGRIVMTPELLSLQWNALSLYPAGFYSRGITVAAEVTLPPGWGFGTALETLAANDNHFLFKPIAYDQLVDSPLLAGRYFTRIALDADAAHPVSLDIAADRPDLLAIKPEQLSAHQALLRQADLVFGPRPFDHYDFLLSVSDRLGGIGLEHHRSSEDGVPLGYFTDWNGSAPVRDLLPHEYAHSWNGKYRRPADLWTPTFNQPMQNSLLWVYEGQTHYWGIVLAARAGLLSRDQAKDAIALIAATYDAMPGRTWKSLQDTTNDPIVAHRRPQPWRSWRRSEDYYAEGALLWLDVDTLIRSKSSGRRSLDDFARGFFAPPTSGPLELTYDFDDVVAGLTVTQPFDWAPFLRSRLDGHGPGAPLDGLARGGYRLVFGDTPSDYEREQMAERKVEDFSFSLGFAVGKDSILTSVLWDGAAFRAGLAMGTKLLAVNGILYDKDRLKDAIRRAHSDTAPIELLVQQGDHFRSVAIDYRGGLRYPRLERTGDGPASLDLILSPK